MSDKKTATKQPIEEIRGEKIRKLEKIKELGINPFPSALRFAIKPIDQVRNEPEDSEQSLAGRLTSIRGHGGIRFADIVDTSGKIQIAFKVDTVGDELFELFTLVDPGDFIEVQGTLFITKAGELTLNVTDFSILTKNLRPLPDTQEGFKDKEQRLRKRYLDLTVNEDTQRVFKIRHDITREMRRFLDDKGLTEVETPTLQPLYGGANAKPFVTNINALDTEAYLRIASELYLKRLMVTNTVGVYDIAKDFRNEGVDQTHFPEFTMMEAYLAYADYHAMMDLMEEMLRNLSKKVLNSNSIQVFDTEINLDKDWPRIPMTNLLQDTIGLDVSTASKEDILNHSYTDENQKESTVEQRLMGSDVTIEELSRGEVISLAFDKLVEVIEPTWVIDYPVEISPLAKEHRTKEGFVERFELYIGGKEIMDGWSEINNPLVQLERFTAENKRSFDETETAQPIDHDYIEAMEYGMPPMAGVGVGIDRLTMFFSNKWEIQETILFPFKKPLSNN